MSASFDPKSDWDAIFIGGGVGALTLAALLAKVKNKKVLVLEKHSKLGGFTHTFKRKGSFQFDIGVHYIGGLHEGSELRSVLDFLTAGKLEWKALPYEFEKLMIDDFEWDVPSSSQEHLKRLQVRFPEEKEALASYFADEKKIAEAYGLWQYAEKFSAPLRKLAYLYLKLFRKDMFRTTGEYLDAKFKSRELKAILTSRWMGFGVPPGESSFGIHCLHSSHYGQGAWYPKEGGEAIARHLVPPILAAGGRVVVNSSVDHILTRGGKAIGVKLKNPLDQVGHEVFSDVVISNAGARATYLNLLNEDVRIPFKKELIASSVGTSVVSLFLGLKASPRQMGFDAINYWFCPTNQDGIFQPELHRDGPLWYFLSFPSLKQGGTQHHTAQILVMTDGEFFRKWNSSRWRRRPQDYEDYKTILTSRILEDLESRCPGFRAQIEYQELSTPLSVEHFHGSPGGSIYGVPSSPERFFAPWAQSRSPLKGLYLTGSDTFSPGISGAIYGALKTFEIVSQTLR